MQGYISRVCFPSDASQVADTSGCRFVGSVLLQLRTPGRSSVLTLYQKEWVTLSQLVTSGVLVHSGNTETDGEALAPAVSQYSGGACSSQTGCRLNNPPFLKRVVPEGQGCLQWCGSMRGNCLRGCFHNAQTMNKLSLLYSGFPSITHKKCE